MAPPNDQPQQPGVATPALQNLISAMITQAMQREGRQLIYSIMNPNADQFAGIDQGINQDQMANIGEMDKLPDIVRSLREFSGQPGEFSSWRKSVERVLKIYEPLRGSPKYFGIINVIRNKIVGHADHILESYNTPLNWNNISRCLTLHYADKRDLGTLEYQMTSLVQGNKSVQEFYHSVYEHLSLILNKISAMEVSGEALNLLMHSYREKALDTFIRGLKGDLPRLLGIREPSDLPQALHLCMKLENQTFRQQYAAATNNNVRKMQPVPPPISSFPPQIPPRGQMPIRYQGNIPFNNYQPKLNPLQANYPQYTQLRPNLPQKPIQQSFYRPQVQQPFYHPQIPNNTKYQQPEPMDTSTIKTNNVNYMNRPSAPKRPNNPPSQQIHPNKLQRNFHVNTSPADPTEEQQYEQTIQNEDQCHDQTLQEYVEHYPQDYSETFPQQDTDDPYNQQSLEFSDIHFLD